MTTTRSFSEKGRAHSVFLSALRRQMGFMVATFIILFITIVVPHLVSGAADGYLKLYGGTDVTEALRKLFQHGIYFSEGQPIFIAVILSITALACALSATRYMHSMKMTDLYHSLPVRREKLLLTNLAASMLAVLGPFLALYLLTMAGQMIAYGQYGWVGPWYFQYAVMDFLTIAIMAFVIYVFTAFVAVNTGTTFDSLAITGALGAMPSIVFLICGGIWEISYYGASFNYNNVLRLSPFLFFFERFRYTDYMFSYSRYPEHDFGAIAGVFAVWFLIGCAFFAAALFCYRRRKSEVAEQTQPRGVLQMIVKFFAAFCGGAMFMLIFSDSGRFAQFIAIALGGLAIGLIAELILTRNIRSLIKNIKWLALSGLVYAILYTGVQQDFFGYERRIPAAEAVSSVSISYRGRFYDDYSNPLSPYYEDDSNYYEITLTQPESIALVRDAQASAIDYYRARGRDGYYWGNNLSIRYNLKNGGALTRWYQSVDGASYQMLARLEENEDFIRQSHPLFFMQEYMSQPGIRMEISASASSVSSNAAHSLNLGAAELSQLITALQTDVLAESLSDIYAHSQAARGYIRLTYRDLDETGSANYQGLDNVLMEEAEFYGYSYGEYDEKYRYLGRDYLTECWVPVYGSYTNTLALLERLGVTRLLEPDYGEISEAVIFPIGNYTGYYYENRVMTAMPGGLNTYRYWGDKSDVGVFSTQSPEEIKALVQKGITRLLITPEARERLLFVQFVSENGDVRGGVYLYSDALPSSLRASVEKYLETKNDDFSGVAMPMPTTEAVTAAPLALQLY